MNIIEQNPFRILGVYTTASLKEITSNHNRISKFISVGKEVKYSSDFGYVERNKESVDQALSQINLAQDKLKYAMFWFANATSIDDIALNHIISGDKEKGMEILSKRNTYSSLINQSIVCIQLQDYKNAIDRIFKVFHNKEQRNDFVQKICGEIFQITEYDIIHLYIDTLLENFPNEDWHEIFGHQIENLTQDDIDYVINKLIESPIKAIENEVALSQLVDRENSEARYKAGENLKDKTLDSYKKLKSILPVDDLRYMKIIDSLAREILQCGIDYYNKSEDEDCIDKALVLQGYALKIAVGNLLKKRCQENVDILNNQKNSANVRAEILLISSVLKSFKNKIDSISNAKALLADCLPYLQTIKKSFGSTNEDYLKISDAVINNALGMTVSRINGLQEGSYPNISALKQDVPATIKMIYFVQNNYDYSSQIATKLSTSLSTLENMNSQLNSISGTSSPYPSPSPDSFWDTDFGGCLMRILVGAGFVFIVWIMSLIFG
ncbi:MAG: hypothetical protein MJZ71_03180 [Bacteroidales bacterium]|nr:hypothetical protein [Bacteroidales bacterium]